MRSKELTICLGSFVTDRFRLPLDLVSISEDEKSVLTTATSHLEAALDRELGYSLTQRSLWPRISFLFPPDFLGLSWQKRQERIRPAMLVLEAVGLLDKIHTQAYGHGQDHQLPFYPWQVGSVIYYRENHLLGHYYTELQRHHIFGLGPKRRERIAAVAPICLAASEQVINIFHPLAAN